MHVPLRRVNIALCNAGGALPGCCWAVRLRIARDRRGIAAVDGTL